MRAPEIKRLIITLLSSARTADGPSHCLGLTSRQICDHIEALVPPDQEAGRARALWNRVVEQLELLESEFEVASKGDGRKSYRMAPPVLIIESEANQQDTIQAYHNDIGRGGAQAMAVGACWCSWWLRLH